MKIFIPIKHESQRVTGKNFRQLSGLPLYKHTLYKLRDYMVFVDTDSDENGYCPVNHNPLKLEQTQSLPTLYEENSAFYMFKKCVFSTIKNRVGKNPAFYKVDHPENFDIDTEDNWKECLKINETFMATTT